MFFKTSVILKTLPHFIFAILTTSSLYMATHKPTSYNHLPRVASQFGGLLLYQHPWYIILDQSRFASYSKLYNPVVRLKLCIWQKANYSSITCPRNSACLLLMLFISFLVLLAVFRISKLVLFSVHDTLSILLKNQISIASMAM